MRYFIDISYFGKNYHGWQIQENAITIQEIIDKSLSIILKSDIKTLGSGRTDTGVHAISQIAHFDYNDNLGNNFLYKVNS
ncbi:MAG: tRNA pseudouridine(38-40) synthase TruA, partial [Bacteroidota bacterium]|nr:tRNA pseudouridine(38-40) synthase TruA [Bacteroidota bacterium]